MERDALDSFDLDLAKLCLAENDPVARAALQAARVELRKVDALQQIASALENIADRLSDRLPGPG